MQQKTAYDGNIVLTHFGVKYIYVYRQSLILSHQFEKMTKILSIYNKNYS